MPTLVRDNLSGKAMGGLALGAAEMAMAATQRAFRILLRLAVAGGLAAVAGIILGALATSGGFAQLALTGFAAFALWIPMFLLLSGIARWRARRAAQPRLARRTGKLTRSSRASWTRLQQLAGPRAGEVVTACNRLALVHERLPGNALDPQAHELRLLIEKRIPQLISSRLSSLPASSKERTEAIDSLVDLVDRFAADSDQRCEQLAQASRSEHEAVRQRIEDHLAAPRF